MMRPPAPGSIGVDVLNETMPAPLLRMLPIDPIDGFGFFEALKQNPANDSRGRVHVMRVDQFWPLLDRLL